MSSIRANNISLEIKGESDAKGRGEWGDAENITLPFVHIVHGKGLKYAHTRNRVKWPLCVYAQFFVSIVLKSSTKYIRILHVRRKIKTILHLFWSACSPSLVFAVCYRC